MKVLSQADVAYLPITPTIFHVVHHLPIGRVLSCSQIGLIVRHGSCSVPATTLATVDAVRIDDTREIARIFFRRTKGCEALLIFFRQWFDHFILVFLHVFQSDLPGEMFSTERKHSELNSGPVFRHGARWFWFERLTCIILYCAILSSKKVQNKNAFYSVFVTCCGGPTRTAAFRL